MYPGLDPHQNLREVFRGQEELRRVACEEAEARWVSRSSRGGRGPTAFKLWRFHVMVWFEDARP